MRLLRSPYAHARSRQRDGVLIRRIDTSQAQALPGVVAVLTHRDVPRRAYSTAGHAEPVPDPLDRFVLDEKVRFVGDGVAAVVAESVAIAARVSGTESLELIRDEQGQILNAGFRYYRIPTAKEVPPIEVHLVQQADPYGPFGAKGVGEITTNCIAPAIANAVFQATGLRLRRLPLTPERVWQGIQSGIGAPQSVRASGGEHQPCSELN